MAGTNDLESRIQQLEAQLAAERERADTASAVVGRLEAEGSTRRSNGDKPVESATRNKPLWPFLVHCLGVPKDVPGKPSHPKLPDEEILAVDESEAIRQFCLMRKDEHGRQLDPTRYTFHATCLKAQERQQQHVNKINNRKLVEAGKLRVLTREQEIRDPDRNLKELALV